MGIRCHLLTVTTFYKHQWQVSDRSCGYLTSPQTLGPNYHQSILLHHPFTAGPTPLLPPLLVPSGCTTPLLWEHQQAEDQQTDHHVKVSTIFNSGECTQSPLCRGIVKYIDAIKKKSVSPFGILNYDNTFQKSFDRYLS